MTEREQLIKKVSKAPTLQEKHKIIFDWFVENVTYNYDDRELAKTDDLINKKIIETNKILKQHQMQEINFNNINKTFKKLMQTKQAKNKLEPTQKDDKVFDLIFKNVAELEKLYIRYKIQAATRDKALNISDVWNGKKAVCIHFAEEYQKVCNECLMPNNIVFGKMYSGDMNMLCYHAWNRTSLKNSNDEPLYVDISSAIHSVEQGKNPYDFFLKTEKEMQKSDEKSLESNPKALEENKKQPRTILPFSQFM